MKLSFKLYIILFLCIFYTQTGIRAQEELFPVYEIEPLNDVGTEEDPAFPLVYNGYVYIFSLHHRLPVWRLFIGGDIISPFAIRDGTIYLYDIFNRFYAIDKTEGKILWKLTVSGEISGRPLLYDRYLIVPTAKGLVYVVDRRNGEIIHTYTGSGEIYADIIRFENLIVVSYKSGDIVAYNIESGEKDWIFRSGGIVTVAPIIDNNTLFFGAWNSTVYSLDVRSGKTRWISYVGKSVTRDFLVFDNEILLFFADGEILSLLREDGAIKWVKYMKEIEFSYNYFAGSDFLYLFMPEFVAMDPADGSIVFNYRERAFNLFKEMLFENMLEGDALFTEEERARILNEIYFSVSNYPMLPPLLVYENYVYFVAEDSYLYVYDLKKDFFVIKYKMS